MCKPSSHHTRLSLGLTLLLYSLVIPKYHGAMLHDLPDEHLADLLPLAKKITTAFHSRGAYNVLQNNGKLAHQV